MSNNMVNIIKLPVSFWRKLGQLAIQWIREDAKQGIMQTPDGTSGKPNYNRKYAELKSNDMRGKDGKRIKKYYAASITSRETGKVDMTLTGQMFRGLKVIEADNHSVTLGYQSADAGKVIGNKQKYNRDVANLNNKNRERAKQMLLEQFSENMRKELKDITINVRF